MIQEGPEPPSDDHSRNSRNNLPEPETDGIDYCFDYYDELLKQDRLLKVLPEYIVEQPYIFLDQKDPRWLDARKTGASEFGSMANCLGAYESRDRIWHRKRNNIPVIVTEPMEYGNKNEPNARATFECNFGHLGELFQVGVFYCENDDRLSCSPDGIFVPHKTKHPWLVEFKCPYSRAPYEEVPAKHRAQLLGMMHITKIYRLLYCVWTPDYPMRVWACDFHEKSWEDIHHALDLFLNSLESGDPLPTPKRGSKLQPRVPSSRDLTAIFEEHQSINGVNNNKRKRDAIRSYYGVSGICSHHDLHPIKFNIGQTIRTRVGPRIRTVPGKPPVSRIIL